jgi:hypothetical protein
VPDRKFGRIRPLILPKDNPDVLHYSASLKPELKPPPPSTTYHKPTMPGIMGDNDEVGSCGPTSAANVNKVQTGNVLPSPIVWPTSTILSVYEAVGGYVPGRPQTDQGVVLSDLWDYWRDTGIAGTNIIAAISVDPANITHIQWAINIFGGGVAGWNLPASAENQTDAGKPWTVVKGSPILGGHATAVSGYDPTGVTLETWAEQQEAAWSFFSAYCEEFWIFLTQQWIDENTGNSPVGLNLTSMSIDAGLL